MWDKVLALGGTLVFPMCHERLNGCDFGVFQFNAKQVSFSGSKGQIFAVSPSEAASIRPLYSNFRLSLSKKNYSLEFNTGHCSDSPSGLVCPEPDMTEQHIVVDYIAKTIQRLAH